MIACSRIALSVVVLASTAGCVTTYTDTQVSRIADTAKGPKVVTFMDDSYIADMSIALAEHGFIVRPMPSQQQVIEMQSAGRLAKFNEASARYAITITNQFVDICSFVGPNYSIRDFTLMLTDLVTNQVTLVLKQRGADGPCRPSKPVFGPLSEALAKNW